MSDILSVFDDVELCHPPVITRDSLLKAVRGLMDASRDDWARGDATVTTISDGTFDTILDALHSHVGIGRCLLGLDSNDLEGVRDFLKSLTDPSITRQTHIRQAIRLQQERNHDRKHHQAR